MQNHASRHSMVLGVFFTSLMLLQGQDVREIVRGKGPLSPWPRFTLQAEKMWQLNSPAGERFDASGLLRRRNGELWTINDRGSRLYRIQFLNNTDEADLVLVPDCFTETQLAVLAEGKVGRWDCEGIAEDDARRLYLCEEGNRWILRFDPKKGIAERLGIDWSPVERYFHPSDRNASFEGIAIGNGKLFVANERQTGRIIVIDLKTEKVIDDFGATQATDSGETNYSDLCWFEGALFALLREQRAVVKIDAKTHRITAEYDFTKLENEPELAYENDHTAGIFEGLAVDQHYIWLVTDNNGMGRKRYPRDTRPTLFKCRRPDKRTGRMEKP